MKSVNKIDIISARLKLTVRMVKSKKMNLLESVLKQMDTIKKK